MSGDKEEAGQYSETDRQIGYEPQSDESRIAGESGYIPPNGVGKLGLPFWIWPDGSLHYLPPSQR
jgi:hypothetical protein